MLKASIQANLDHGRLTVVSYSPGLFVHMTRDSLPLDMFLSAQGAQGWRVVNAAWQGFELTLTMEQTTEIPYLPPSYLIQCLYLTRSFISLSEAAISLKSLVDDFRQHARQDGWTELCTSKPLAVSGIWIVTIWMREADQP